MTAALLIGLIGLLCFYLEFFIPGGILAIIGGVLVIGSSILFCLKADSYFLGFLYVIVLLLSSIFTCILALRHMRRSGSRNSFFLQSDQKGFTAEKIEEELVGKTGIVSTELKPAGHVRIDGKIYQATSEGPFLPKGSPIEVIELKGSRVIVQSKEERK